jgi:hypothetical protein
MPRPKKRAAANPQEEPETVVKRQKGGTSSSSKQNESFQMRNLISWFKTYADEDDQQMGPHAMEQFCKDIGVEPEVSR